MNTYQTPQASQAPSFTPMRHPISPDLMDTIVQFVKDTSGQAFNLKEKLTDHFIENLDVTEFLSLKFQQALYEEVKGGVELGYIDYRDDGLNAEDIAEAIYSQEGLDMVREKCWEAYLDQEHDSMWELIEEVFDAFWDKYGEDYLDRDKVYGEVVQNDDAPREIVQDHNTFDAFSELVKHTRSVVFQYQLGHADGPLGQGSFEWTDTEDAVRDLYRMLGVDRTHGTQLDQILKDLVAECSPEMGMVARPVFLVSLDVEDIMDIAQTIHYGARDPQIPTSVTFRHPSLCLLDAWNGKGNETAIPGEFTLEFNLDRLHVDEVPRSGYGWCDVICQTPSGLGGATFNYEGDAS